MVDRIAEYNKRIFTYTSEKQKLQKTQNPLHIIRLGLFLCVAFLIYLFLTAQSSWILVLAATVFILLLVLSAYDNKLKRLIKRLDVLIGINRKEIISIGGDNSAFDPGNEFIDQSHDYTHDLDIFGQGSLFQFVNRSATIFGKNRLADYLSNAFGYSKQVAERQEAIKELSGIVDQRQNLQLIFSGQQIAVADHGEIIQWLEGKSPITNMKLLWVLAFSLPAATIACILLSIIGIMAFPVFLVVLQISIVFLYGRQTMKVQEIITSKSKILNRYAQCLKIIESTGYKSSYLAGIQNQLVNEREQSPSEVINQLSVILKYMDSNLNLLVAILLNGLFMFNLHLLIRAEKWKNDNKGKVPGWFDSIATIDALSSLANYAYNYPEFVYPNLLEEEFGFIGKDLGHPLILAKERVVNDVEINGWNQFYIITGANMSGKSTFLRTIGVNYILAMIGAPVCASALSFYPIQIHSSIRTSDSLVKHESYFYAELKRLKQIIDELESGSKKLILLDEILKGTNSKDKQSGSIALIEQLLNYKSVGLFATHDLILGELADRYPDHVKNLCFEIAIESDKMLIDYKLHPGVCKNLNATYLMKNMGILFEKLS